MRGNPAVPGGPLTSRPRWSNTSGRSTTSAFFRGGAVRSQMHVHPAKAGFRDQGMNREDVMVMDRVVTTLSFYD